MKQEHEQTIHYQNQEQVKLPACTRREFLRHLTIGGAGALTLGRGVLEARAAGRYTDNEVKPEPEEEAFVDGVHNALHLNEHGFYEIPFYSGEVIPPSAVVVHWTGALYDPMDSAGGVVNALRGNTACRPGTCGYSIFGDVRGYNFQLGESLNTRMIHAPGMNNYALGFAYEARGENDILNNPVQYQSGLRAIRKLVELFDIPLVHDVHAKTGVLGHFETSNVYDPESGKGDPGVNIMNMLRADLAA